MIVRSVHRTTALATVFALALALAPCPARAEGDAEAEKFDWARFFDYASCAASIAVIEAPGAGFMVAAITCGRVIQKYWT